MSKTETAATTTSAPSVVPDAWLPLTGPVVDRIVEIDDTALRNLWITQSYADLASRLLEALETDQTWCSFATWASNTAGLSIREAELPHVLDSIFRGAEPHLDALATEINAHHGLFHRLGLVRLGILRRVRGSGLGHLVEQALTEVSDLIADGNTLVYGELAPVFVRLAEWLEADGASDPDLDVDNLLHDLGVPSADDDPHVNLAFRSYVAAATTDDDDDRAQYVLAANIAAVLHEQQRLQADIRDALDAGLLDFTADLDSICHRFMPDRMRRWIVERAHQRALPHLLALWEHVATRMLMTLAVPGQTLHLGIDVPPLPNGQIFPAALHDVSHDQLNELLDEWDPTNGTGRGSAAHDWADLHQRMGYIVNLFRSRQQESQLSTSPFTRLELATMRDGAVPKTV